MTLQYQGEQHGKATTFTLRIIGNNLSKSSSNYQIDLLVNDKKVYLSIASGAIFSEGPYKSYDFSESYLRTVFAFLGMTDVTTFRVEGTAIPDFAANALPKALSSVEEFAF